MSGYYMPYSELAECFGKEDADTIVRAFGGLRVFVPEVPPPDHPHIAALGAELAAKLGSHIATGIGGLHVDFPIASFSAKFNATERLRELVVRGDLSEVQISRQLGVHGRTVRRMRAKIRKERQEASQIAV
ncbi:MAG: hypothetical protein PGN34_18340 [Methylobacterium frigidaeris]